MTVMQKGLTPAPKHGEGIAVPYPANAYLSRNIVPYQVTRRKPFYMVQIKMFENSDGVYVAFALRPSRKEDTHRQ